MHRAAAAAAELLERAHRQVLDGTRDQNVEVHHQQHQQLSLALLQRRDTRIVPPLLLARRHDQGAVLQVARHQLLLHPLSHLAQERHRVLALRRGIRGRKQLLALLARLLHRLTLGVVVGCLVGVQQALRVRVRVARQHPEGVLAGRRCRACLGRHGHLIEERVGRRDELRRFEHVAHRILVNERERKLGLGVRCRTRRLGRCQRLDHHQQVRGAVDIHRTAWLCHHASQTALLAYRLECEPR